MWKLIYCGFTMLSKAFHKLVLMTFPLFIVPLSTSFFCFETKLNAFSTLKSPIILYTTALVLDKLPELTFPCFLFVISIFISCMYIFMPFNIYVLLIYVMTSSLLFFWNFWVCNWVCPESMFFVPFWSLFLLFVCFALFCVLVYALPYYILLLSLRSLLCNERQKGGGLKKKGRWGETGRYRGRETVMIYIYEKINFLSFFIVWP